MRLVQVQYTKSAVVTSILYSQHLRSMHTHITVFYLAAGAFASPSSRTAQSFWNRYSAIVQYRDIFWAPTPSPNSWQCIEGKEAKDDRMFPVLHDGDMDLSIVGRDDCGHMWVDVELCDPFKHLLRERAYILVSLPMIARWHTSERFDAERILRQSGKFDYSELKWLSMVFHWETLIVRSSVAGHSC